LTAYKQKDFDTALSIWNEEAKLKNDKAMANLGLMYLKGEGVQKDYSKAKEWFDEASKYDNDSANFNLALMYQTKIGVEEDVEKAKDYFRRAVSKNHTQAAFRLALLLLQDRNNIDGVKEGFDCTSFLFLSAIHNPKGLLFTFNSEKELGLKSKP
ncbi:MAG: tetratricopeptide repeat protein, partial [Sulfurimonas sp.]